MQVRLARPARSYCFFPVPPFRPRSADFHLPARMWPQAASPRIKPGASLSGNALAVSYYDPCLTRVVSAASRANRSARKRAVFSRTATRSALYSATALGPSICCISFRLKADSARARTCSDAGFTNFLSLPGSLLRHFLLRQGNANEELLQPVSPAIVPARRRESGRAPARL
jgi:hypothetical protein